MANTPQDPWPLLPVIPEYKPWLDRVIKETAADAKAVDAGFAARQGPVSAPAGSSTAGPATAPAPAKSPEQASGGVTDETA